MKLHSTTAVSKKSNLGEGVQIGLHSIIKDNVTIGPGTRVGAFCVIEGNTTIGKNCKIFTGTVLGSIPQDLKFKKEESFLKIGDDNIIREYCTFNLGTEKGGQTVVGNGNLFMAYSHVAHDCVIGNNCIIANNGTLAGHVTIEDHAVVGGLVAIHQFARVGRLSIIGGCSKVVQDIPPYSTCDGHPARVYGLNLVGLRRADIDKLAINELSHAFKIIFNSGFSAKHAIQELESYAKSSLEVAYLISFIKNSKRGICRGVR
jgi:UDP-N-acetylglucosamine acyltransferase